MTTKITAGSGYITVQQYGYPYVANNGQSAGQVRYNTSTQSLEAYDGMNWIDISSTVSVGVDGHALSIFNWAMQKMMEEARLEQLAKDNPMISSAVDALNEASDRLKVAIALTQP